MGLFRRRSRVDDLPRLVAQRDQLAAELAQLDADAAWASISDDVAEAADGRHLRRQADALRRSIAELDARIATAARASD